LVCRYTVVAVGYVGYGYGLFTLRLPFTRCTVYTLPYVTGYVDMHTRYVVTRCCLRLVGCYVAVYTLLICCLRFVTTVCVYLRLRVLHTVAFYAFTHVAVTVTFTFTVGCVTHGYIYGWFYVRWLRLFPVYHVYVTVRGSHTLRTYLLHTVFTRLRLLPRLRFTWVYRLRTRLFCYTTHGLRLFTRLQRLRCYGYGTHVYGLHTRYVTFTRYTPHVYGLLRCATLYTYRIWLLWFITGHVYGWLRFTHVYLIDLRLPHGYVYSYVCTHTRYVWLFTGCLPVATLGLFVDFTVVVTR